MEDILEDILQHIAHLRKKGNFSQSEMAEKMKMTQSSYARFETGKSKTDLSDLISFCKCLNISLKQFFELSDNFELSPQGNADFTIKLIDGSKEEFIRILRSGVEAGKK